jgi:hypothetical protein
MGSDRIQILANDSTKAANMREYGGEHVGD